MKPNVDFEAHDNTIKEVLFSTNSFQVPRYQRPYAWDTDQISEFWDDIIGSGRSPFIGSIILNYETMEKFGYIDIIDGQQRLLTITIFIAVLRDIAKSIDNKTAELYQRHDIAIEDRSSGKMTYRILAGDQTRDFFEKNIQDFRGNIFEANPETAEAKRIKKNYIFLYEKVKNELKKYINKEDQLKYLNALREKMANLTVIHIQIDNEEEAYEIFETTNARGIDLSVADLLKNLIFKKLPPDENKDFAREVWEDITNNIEETNTEMKRFIRYYWISRHGAVTQKKLFREIKKETVNYNKLLEDIWSSSELYNKIVEGGAEDWENYKSGQKIYRSILALRIMNVSQCYVLFLTILRNIDKMGTDPARIFELIENFTFHYSVVCKLPTNKLEKIYGNCSNKIEEAMVKEDEKRLPGKIQSIFSDLEKELKEEAPSAEYFTSEFMDLCYKNSEQYRKLIKYILGKIDSHYRATKEEMIDFDHVNIEHLLPQKPDKAWGLHKRDIKAYVNKLGNLTLIDKRINSKVGNKTIKEKIPVLSQSSLPMNKVLIDQLTTKNHVWNESYINERQKEFAELAYDKVWKL